MNEISDSDREIADRVIKAADAVCTIAYSNFPNKTNVNLSADGSMTASVTVAHYELSVVLRLARAALAKAVYP